MELVVVHDKEAREGCRRGHALKYGGCPYRFSPGEKFSPSRCHQKLNKRAGYACAGSAAANGPRPRRFSSSVASFWYSALFSSAITTVP